MLDILLFKSHNAKYQFERSIRPIQLPEKSFGG